MRKIRMRKIRMRLDGSADLREPFSGKSIERYTERIGNSQQSLFRVEYDACS